MNNVSKYIDKLAKDLVCKINEKRLYRFRIKIIHYFTQSFGFQKIEFARNTLDLYDFAKKCSIFFAFDSTINLNAKNLMKSIDEAVIANIHGIRYPRAYGLTIYFPFLKELYSSGLPFYIDSDFGLDFTNDTHWDEFLELYLS